MNALSVLSAAWLAIIAVIRVKFAKTIALGASIGIVIEKTVGRIVIPIMIDVLPEKYKKWIPVIVAYAARSVGVSIAWTIQSVISAFHSAVRGGFLLARLALTYQARTEGKQFKEEETFADEAFGFGLAFFGFSCQMLMEFRVPFPLNIPLLPLSISEWTLRFWLSETYATAAS